MQLIYVSIPRLDPEFQETIVKYCLRVIDQSKVKLPTMTDASSGKLIVNSNRDIADVALIECIRILDLLCKFDSTLVCYKMIIRCKFFCDLRKM
jgi:hypothetical protein